MPRSEIIIYWSQADEAFIAEVPELPGCAADGETCKEALAGVEIIIQEWIETATRHSAVPSPRRRAASPSPERFSRTVPSTRQRKSKVKNPWFGSAHHKLRRTDV